MFNKELTTRPGKFVKILSSGFRFISLYIFEIFFELPSFVKGKPKIAKEEYFTLKPLGDKPLLSGKMKYIEIINCIRTKAIYEKNTFLLSLKN